MGRVRNYVNNLNFISVTYFTFIVLVTIFLGIYIFNFQAGYLKYQQDEVKELKSEISTIIEKEDMKDFIELGNDYAFDIIVQQDTTILYTSNTLYDIDEADSVFNDNYVYKEVYEEDGYLIWLNVSQVDMVPFVNQYLIVATSIVLLLIIATFIFLRVTFVKSSKPILRVIKILDDLKTNDYSDVIYESKLDIVSEELLLLYNEISFQTYKLKQEQEEYQRINKVQKSLLEEQKQYLETVVHDIKSPLASINYSRFIIENGKKQEQIKDALGNIKLQSEEALNLIITTLGNVRDDSREVFINEDEINIEDMIKSYLEKNKMLLEKNGLTTSVVCNRSYLEVNKLKFIQLINNILSNMLNYSKEKTELEIDLSKEALTFKNEIGSSNNEYSTHYGKSRIEELAHELNMEIETTQNNGSYQVRLILGDYYE